MPTDRRIDDAISFYIPDPRTIDDPAWTIGPIHATIAWEPILQVGAEELAKAFGSSVGSGLGQAFLDAILGKSNQDAQFQHEVIQRLERIEQKLDSLIAFIRSELPELIQTLLREEFVEADRIALQTSRSQVADAIAQVPANGTPDADQIALLEQAAINAANCGERLLRRGPACYMAGIHALAAMISAYSRIARVKPKKLKSLASRAQTFAELTKPWVDPALPTSFPSLLAAYTSKLAEAERVIATLPANQLVSITSPITWGAPGAIVPPGSATFGYWGSFSRDGSGNILGIFHYANEVKQIQPALEDPVDPNVFAARVGLTTHFWWQAPVLKPSEGNPNQAGAAFDKAFAVLTSASTQVSKNPQKIAEFDLAINALRDFVQSCHSLTALS